MKSQLTSHNRWVGLSLCLSGYKYSSLTSFNGLLNKSWYHSHALSGERTQLFALKAQSLSYTIISVSISILAVERRIIMPRLVFLPQPFILHQSFVLSILCRPFILEAHFALKVSATIPMVTTQHCLLISQGRGLISRLL